MIIDGKVLARDYISTMKKAIQPNKYSVAILYFGEENSTDIYMRNIKRVGNELCINVKEIVLSNDKSQEYVINKIKELNVDENINGIFVSNDIPKSISYDEIAKVIDPKKDVDCVTPHNIGLHFMGESLVCPCTARSVVKLIELQMGLKFIEGKKAVVIGRNNVVGKPIAMSLLQNNATITICHSKTPNIEDCTKDADIVVASVGIPNFLKKDMVREDVVIIDVGINYHNGKLCGDVDFEELKDKSSAITPVPGGVGSMTVAMFYQNLLDLINN